MNFKHICSVLLVLLFTKAFSQPHTTDFPSDKSTIAFEQNKGQVWDLENNVASYVKYYFNKGNMSIFMLPTGIAYQFDQLHYPEGYEQAQTQLNIEEQKKLSAQVRLETYRMDMKLVGANPQARIIAEGKIQSYVNYYNRNTLDVHSFEKLTYKNIYPGIDWVIYTTKEGLKYDFVVHPGANPDQILMRFKHQEALKVNEDGSLTISNRMGQVTEKTPLSFQGTQTIGTQFKLHENTVQFQVANYDPQQKLIIDPSLVWATYYGGNDRDYGYSCVTDSMGNAYVAGETRSIVNIAAGGHQNSYTGGTDAFLVKLNSSGVRLWATYYGGTAFDHFKKCTIYKDAIFVAGSTLSSGGISSNGYQNGKNGNYDAFLVKFNSNGVRQWATYYGGNESDRGETCVLDNQGNIYLAGSTKSTSNIAHNGHQNVLGGFNTNDAFLVKFDSSGGRLWATYYGGLEEDYAYDCAVDLQGNVFLAGTSRSDNNIAFNGIKNSNLSGYEDAFLVKFDSNGVRQWGTFYGGPNNNILEDEGYSCATDSKGNIYLAGITNNFSNMAINGHQNSIGRTLSGAYTQDAFLVKFNPLGGRVWATYYGGEGYDYGYSCHIDKYDNVYLTGRTASADSIAFNGAQNTLGGNQDAFLVKFDSMGVRLWGSYYGGTNIDYSNSIYVDPQEDVYITGRTISTDNTITSGVQQDSLGGSWDAFVAKFQGNFCLTSNDTLTQSACFSYIYNGQTYTSTGIYLDTLINQGGCDSIITLDLTILNPTTGTDTQSACGSYTWIDGNTYTSSNNTATYTLAGAAANGCDSIVSLDLTIQTINTNVSQAGDSLTAVQTGASYQWIDCENNNLPIPGAIVQSFVPSNSGKYAVQITLNGCTETSACIDVITTGISVMNQDALAVDLYPNPTTGAFTLVIEDLKEANVRIYTSNGQLLQDRVIRGNGKHQLEINGAAGIYFLQIQEKNQITYIKLLKK